MPAEKASLANPVTLQPNAESAKVLQVVIETPRNSRNKYAFDHDQGAFVLKKVLPAGMSFPHDFGFVPRTTAPDGDPIDVLLLMDEPAFPGCIVPARLLGVVKAEQTEDRKTTRNDRLIAVAEASEMYATFEKLGDLTPSFLNQLQLFFVNYNKIAGKRYKLLGYSGPKVAHALIASARKTFDRSAGD